MSTANVAASLKESLRYLDKMARPNARDIRDALTRPSSFGLSSRHEHYADMFRTWSLGPVIEHRDSDVISRANAASLRAYLESRPELADDWCATGASHWAVGHVDHLSFRALNDDGTPSEMLRIMLAWNEMLQEYPIADDDLHSTMECDEVSRSWDSWQARDVRRDIVKELVSRIPESPSDDDMTADEIEAWLDEVSDERLWDLVHDRGEIYDGSLHLSSRDIEAAANALVEG